MNHINKKIFLFVFLFIFRLNLLSQSNSQEKYISIVDSTNSEIKIIKKESRITVQSQNDYSYDGKLKEVYDDSIIVARLNWVGDEKSTTTYNIHDITEIGYVDVAKTMFNRSISSGIGGNRTYKMIKLTNKKYKLVIKNQNKRVYEKEDSD